MFFSSAVIGVIAGAAGAAEKERLYQGLCRAAKENGQPKPERVAIQRRAEDPKESSTPWWSLALAVLIGANL